MTLLMSLIHETGGTMRQSFFCRTYVVLALAIAASQQTARRRPESPPIKHIRKNVQGWTVRVDSRLVGAEKELGCTALRTLANKLHSIKLVMPRKPLRKLLEVLEEVWAMSQKPQRGACE